MKTILATLLVAFILMLSGCSGGGKTAGADTAAASTVRGVAAAGSVITGTVYLKDSSSQEVSAPIGADGTYSFDVANLTAPFLLKAVGTANDRNWTLYSLADKPGIANINPLTHLAVVRANSGSEPSSLYVNLTASRLQTVGAALPAAIAQIRSLLAPLFSKYDVAAADFMNGPYAVDHLGYDLLFDTVAVEINGGSLIITNRCTGAAILTTPMTGSALTGEIVTADIPTISTQPVGTVFVYPASSTVVTGGAVRFRSIVKGAKSQEVTWSVAETEGGSITASGLYTAPQNAGTYHVVATNPADPSKTATATVRVVLPNFVSLQSDYGDYIGTGRTYRYTNTNATITLTATGGHLEVTISGDQRWSGDFQVPADLATLQPGTYTDLHRYPFYTPGLNWSGEGRGSNTLTGWFAIDNAIYVSGVLKEVDLRFEQHSEGSAPALHGQIHWTAADTGVAPGSVNPPPSGLWSAPAGSTPLSGNYVYLQSDAGDYIGGGRTYSYAGAGISVNGTGGHLGVWVEDSESWTGDFQAMSSLYKLEPGYYGDLMRYPFQNPAKGGLSWDGNGRGCNRLTGWFVIDNISYVDGTVSTVDARFEQHCDGATPALHGQIHWSR